MNQQTIVSMLSQHDFTQTYIRANEICQREKKDIIDIRAILEFSNYCRCSCAYCGLNREDCHSPRYRMSPAEIINTVKQAKQAGYQTIVLQSGEDPFYTKELVGDMIKEIKKTNIKVTLGLGERSYEEYAYWRDCGADRYLIKHETADRLAYDKLHPHSSYENRIDCLKMIKSLGYETGSGFMIGLPHQTLETVANDLLLLKELRCDMAGIGPFIAHPKTTLRHVPNGSTELTRRAVALARILMPEINLPATTSLGVINSKDKDEVFSNGANVIMHKVTPSSYKELYDIYPSRQSKTNIIEDRKELEKNILALGKIPR